MDRRVIAQLCDSIDAVANMSHTDAEDHGTVGKRVDDDVHYEDDDGGFLKTNVKKMNKFVVLIAATNK